MEEFRGASIEKISTGLKHGLDVSTYARVDYTWQQMRKIRLGLENGINVESYCSLMYTTAEMKRMRTALEDGAVEYFLAEESRLRRRKRFPILLLP